MVVSSANALKFLMHAQHGWRNLIKPYLISTFGIRTSVTVGDFIYQYLERNKNNRDDNITLLSSSSTLPWWNRRRPLVMCTSATFVVAPWNFTLSRIIEKLFPGKHAIQIVKKMLTNTLFAPIGICLVFISVTLLNGRSLHEAKTKIQNDMLKTFLTGTCYWAFVSFINFRFVPLDYRPFVGSLARVMWDVYISFTANATTNNSTNTIQTSTGTKTTFVNNTNEKTISLVEKIFNIFDHNKKDL